MFSITPSVIIEYLYCPRYTFFEHVLKIPQFEEKYSKVLKGRKIHDEKLERNKEYLRKKIGVTEKFLDVFLAGNVIRGIVDEVLFLKDGTAAALDYKFAEFNGEIYDTYLTQIYCYSLLIKENTGRDVNRGYLVYTRSKNKLVEIPVTSVDLEKVEKTAGEILELVETGILPDTKANIIKCNLCTYSNICVK